LALCSDKIIIEGDLKVRYGRKKRTYLIIGLCAMLMIMVVGYAAFASNLTINGTAEISSHWCVGFDSLNGTITKTAGISGGTVPSASTQYNGNVCGVSGSFNTGVNLSATFKQPGDVAEYIFVIKNDSSLPARIDSINVNGKNTVSNYMYLDGNIIFSVEMPLKTALTAGESTTMKVIAKFQNSVDVTGEYEGESANVTISINASQDNGDGGFDVVSLESDFDATTGTGTIYRYSSKYLANDGSRYATTFGYKSTIDDLELGKDYATTYNDLVELNPRSMRAFLKHTVSNFKIIETYACVMTDTEHCLKGADTGTAHQDDIEILRSMEPWFISSYNEYNCTALDGYDSRCIGGPFNILSRGDGDAVVIYGAYGDADYAYCGAYDQGYSYCN